MKITLPGTVCFIVLVVAFFAWFGGPPTLPDEFPITRRGIGRAWFHCSLLFVTGAGTACFGEKEVGLFPPISLRWLFIAVGIAIMGVTTVWMHSLIQAWTHHASAFLFPPSATLLAGKPVQFAEVVGARPACKPPSRTT